MEAGSSLWFLAPGLAHQLGNALFTLHGRAQLLPPAGTARRADDRQAILEAVERARGCLHVLRWLLDEAPEPVPAGEVLEGIGSLLRVPLRDRGLAFELALEGGAALGAVEPGPLSRLVVAACRRLATLAVPGPQGALRLGARPDAPGWVWIAFALASAPGSLPFPVDPEHLAEPLRAELHAARAEPVPAAGLAFAFRIPVVAATLPES
jgi:hypothetical protein